MGLGLHTLYTVNADMGAGIGITTSIIIIALGIWGVFVSFLSKHVLPGVPQLRGVPLLGVMPEYFRHGMPHVIERLTATGQHGVSYAKVFNVTLVSVHEPSMVKEVLALPEQNATREGRPGSMNWSPFQTLFRLIGKSLFTYTGSDVHPQRVAYTQEFNSGKANAVAFETIAKISCAHIDALTTSTAPAEIDDIKYAMDNFALALWGEHLYGNPDHYLDSQVLPVSDRIVELCGSPWPAIRYSLLALTRLVTPGKSTQGEASLRCQVTDIVDRNFKVLERNERDHPNAEPKTMRRISMQTGGSKTGPFSEFAVEFAHLNIFGGHHSIGSLLTWLLIELDRHPSCLSKLTDEIRDIDPTHPAFLTAKTPYLDAVLNEVHRLYPTVHATVRAINCETRLSTSTIPVVLKPGMLVYLSLMHLHTSPKYWGADAKEFVPERFLDNNKEAVRNPAFMPFSSGPRSCVGYKFANLAIKVFLVRLLQRCRVEVRDGDHTVEVRTLLETAKPVAVTVTRKALHAQECRVLQ